MAIAEELIDTSRPPGDVTSPNRRRWLRIVVPPLGALLLVLLVVGITLYTARLNREDALRLTGELITALENSIRREVQTFLAPTRAVVTFIADMAATGIVGEPDFDRELERVLRRLIWRTQRTAALFVGDDEGDFVMVQRLGPDRVVSKFVANSGDARQVRLITRDIDGNVLEDRLDPDDAFDPRSRPWFGDAADVDEVRWSDVYRFFTTGSLGITASYRSQVIPDVPATVVGIDVELSEIGQFLDRIDLGPDGRLVMIDANGRIIAARSDTPGLDRALAGDEDTVLIEQLGDPVLNRVFQRFRVGREQAAVVEIEDRSFVVAANSLMDLVGRDWWLFLAVPEARFVGFIAENANAALRLSLAVLGLATLAAGLVTWHGLRADRQIADAAAAQRAVRAQGQALEGLGTIPNLRDTNDTASLEALTRLAARALGARRLGVWEIDGRAARLVSLDVYDADIGGHSAAAALPAAHLGAFWDRLVAGERFVVDAEADRSAPLVRYHMAPVGMRRLDSIPIQGAGGTRGVLWVEDGAAIATAMPTAEGICAVVAALLAPRLDAQVRRGPPEIAARAALSSALPPAGGDLGDVAPAALRRSAIGTVRDAHLIAEINARPDLKDRLDSHLFPRLAVLQLHLGDDVALAARGGDGGAVALQRIVELARETAERCGVRYLKLLGETIVAADGFDRPAEDAVRAVADLALDLQRDCREVLTDVGGTGSFRFGMDLSSGAGAAVGFTDPSFNLWGDSVSVAGALTATAPTGAIQVSESVYDALQGHYILRRRGGFFLAGVGMTESYVLLGAA